MDIKVKVQFRDIDHFSKVYNPGEVVDFPPERAKSIVAKGLAEFPEAAPAPVKKPTNKKKSGK